MNDLENFLSRYRDPIEARLLLEEMGFIDKQGRLTERYKEPTEQTENPMDEKETENYSSLFF